MQYTKIRKDLLFVLNPLLITLGILAFCFISSTTELIFRLFWITTFCSLWLIVTPLGSKRLAHSTEDITLKLPWQQWFLCIALLELALFGVYLGITAISSTLLPVNTNTHLALFSTSLRAFLIQDGLFPWPLYAVIAVGMAALSYCDQTNAYFSNLLKSVTKQEPQETYSLIANVSLRRCVLFAISTLFVFFTLLIMSLVLPLHVHIAHGFQPAAIITTIFILFIPFSDTCTPYITRLFSRHVSTRLSIPVFCIALGFITLVLSVVSSGLWRQTTASFTPVFITQWINHNWPDAWILFSASFWMCLTPLVSVFIARISRGYCVRSIMMGVLILPVALALFLFFQDPLSTTFEFTPAVTKIISVVAFLILLPMLLNHTHLSDAIFAYFPKNGVHKVRDHHAFFINIARLTAVSMYLYLVIGINGLSVLLFSSNYLSILILSIAALAVVKHCLKH